MAPASDSDLAIDFYELLSVPANATESEIRRAYRKTSLLYHPDKVKPTPETSAKFQLLQVALNTLTDAAEKEKYDQNREAKQRRLAENAALEGRRRKMKEDLEMREGGVNGSATKVNGVKRTWTDRELQVKKIAEENQKRREAMMQAKAQKAQSQADTEVEEPSDSISRSVKVRWLREGVGLEIDQDSLTDMLRRFGDVENVLVLKDKKRRIDGREKKVVIATAVVIFASLLGAKKAIEGGAWDGVESVSWAAEKEEPS